MKKLVYVFRVLNFLLFLIVCYFTYGTVEYYLNDNNHDRTSHITSSLDYYDMYNSKINSYLGMAKPGVDVKSLVDAIISTNNAHINNSGSFVSIEFGTANGGMFENAGGKFKGHITDAGSNGYDLAEGSQYGEIGHAGELNNTESYVDDTSSDMLVLKSIVNTSRRYNIEAEYSKTNGHVIKVIINETNAEIVTPDSNIKEFAGEMKEGNVVSSLIDTIIKVNSKNVNKSGKFISIEFGQGYDGMFFNTNGKFRGHITDAGSNGYNLAEGSQYGEIGKAGEPANTASYVNDTNYDMLQLKSIVNTDGRYDVEVRYSNDGSINKVLINERVNPKKKYRGDNVIVLED